MPGGKNPNIKKANAETAYTPHQLQEFAKCAKSPEYFIRNYVMIQHPTRGAVPFKMYDYQANMIDVFQKNKYVSVLASRQVGKSITSVIYLLWFAMFHFDKKILIASNKNKGAIEMIHRIRYAYEKLPHWLKPGVNLDGWNKHSLSFSNDSSIVSTATSEDSGRGEAISLLYLDEFAFVKPNIQEAFWTSILPTLSTGGSCIMSSTPNGDSDLFSTLWRSALVGKALETDAVDNITFTPLQVKWDEPPGRDEKFKKQQIGLIGEQKWRQEYLCEFLSSETLLINSIVLAELTNTVANITPIETIKEVTFFKEIIPGGTYLVGVDPSTGSGEDFSVIEVFDFPSMDQVAEYRSNTMSSVFLYKLLKGILSHLHGGDNTVLFSIENNGVGEGLISLYEADEHPPEGADLVSDAGSKRLGMTTTPRSKLRSCLTLKELIERKTIHVKSKILAQELKSYIRHAGSYAAMRGSSDDTISALLIVIRLIEELSSYDEAAYAKLNSIDASDDDWWGSDDNSDGEVDSKDGDDDYLPVVF